MNGYFQLECREEGTFLHLYPATENGEEININEMGEYLAKKNIKFDIRELNRKMIEVKSNGIIQLDDVKRYPEREMIVVKVAQDKMSACARFYPPSIGGNLLSAEDIMSDLHTAKVNFGIDKDAINAFVLNREYCKDIILARGKMPRHGKDASIEYFFTTDLSAKPSVKEDGSVDFFNLNIMNHVKSGDLLAKLTKEDPGDIGVDVLGARVKPRDVKKLVLKCGKNIQMNEDHTQAFSEVNGHVVLVDGQIFVSNVYQVQNVDNSTGNIEYEGNVLIAGNVNSNFTVKAMGDIEVMGVVEGATLIAGGNIVVAKGINGMGKGNIRAEGNIIARYIENATVFASGYVDTEAIMHSKVSSRSEIIVERKKGIISGSFVSATNSVSVKNLGSQMGSDTVVELGTDPTLKERRQVLLAQMDQANRNIRQLQPVVMAASQKMKQGIKLLPEQMKTIQDMLQTISALQEQLKKDEEEIQEIEASLGNTEIPAQILVRDIIYSGTRIVIGESAMVTKEDFRYCKFIRKDGDIKMLSL